MEVPELVKHWEYHVTGVWDCCQFGSREWWTAANYGDHMSSNTRRRRPQSLHVEIQLVNGRRLENYDEEGGR